MSAPPNVIDGWMWSQGVCATSVVLMLRCCAIRTPRAGAEDHRTEVLTERAGSSGACDPVARKRSL